MTLDAGARQLVRMSLARPLADDPVLLGRQQHMAALKVVGSGVDAGQVGLRENRDERASAVEPGDDDPSAAGDDRCRGPAARPVARRAHTRRARPRAAAAGTQRRGAGRRRAPSDRRDKYARSTPHSATARAWCSSPTGRLTGIPPTCR